MFTAANAMFFLLSFRKCLLRLSDLSTCVKVNNLRAIQQKENRIDHTILSTAETLKRHGKSIPKKTVRQLRSFQIHSVVA